MGARGPSGHDAFSPQPPRCSQRRCEPCSGVFCGDGSRPAKWGKLTPKLISLFGHRRPTGRDRKINAQVDSIVPDMVAEQPSRETRRPRLPATLRKGAGRPGRVENDGRPAWAGKATPKLISRFRTWWPTRQVGRSDGSGSLSAKGGKRTLAVQDIEADQPSQEKHGPS